jgi:hypothetical protein
MGGQNVVFVSTSSKAAVHAMIFIIATSTPHVTYGIPRPLITVLIFEGWACSNVTCGLVSSFVPPRSWECELPEAFGETTYT